MCNSQFAIMSAPTLSQYAGVDALRQFGRRMREMRDSYNQHRRYLVKRFKDLSIAALNLTGALHLPKEYLNFGLSSEDYNALSRGRTFVVVPRQPGTLGRLPTTYLLHTQ